MGRRRRRRRNRTKPLGLLLLIGAAACTWWVYHEERSTAGPDEGVPLTAPLEPPAAEPPPLSATAARNDPEPARVAEPEPTPATPTSPTAVPSDPPTPDRAAALIDTGREALAKGDKLAARLALNEAFRSGLRGEQENFVRGELTRLANETILSPAIVPGDPLAERYVIRTGDVLAKIAVTYKISADALANINGIVDKNLIREGQTIKVLKGPFRAVVRKGDYTLDLFLGDTFVRRFPVGLGADDSTPTGEWRVSTKLVNPTYYPPRGGQIVAADDPANPLGERWIGLVGVSGEAVAQQRYGIHGTNEPDSIGKSLSMGCIRMHNADVETVYAFLVEQHSTVTVLE